MDDAIPSGNGIAVSSLGRLGHLLGEPRYLQVTESTLRAAWPSIDRYPSAHNTLLHALDEHLSPPQSTIIRYDDSNIATWMETYRKNKQPFNLFMCIPKNTPELPGLLGKQAAEAQIVAYICRSHQCLEPILSLDLLRKNLNNPS